MTCRHLKLLDFSWIPSNYACPQLLPADCSWKNQQDPLTSSPLWQLCLMWCDPQNFWKLVCFSCFACDTPRWTSLRSRAPHPFPLVWALRTPLAIQTGCEIPCVPRCDWTTQPQCCLRSHCGLTTRREQSTGQDTVQCTGWHQAETQWRSSES